MMKRFFAFAAFGFSVIGSLAQSPPMIIDNLIVTNMTAGGDIWTPGVGQVFIGNWLWSTGGITVGSAPLQGSLEQDAVGWFTDKPWQFGPGAFCSMLAQDGSVVIIDNTHWLGAISNETTRARYYGDGLGLTNITGTVGLTITQHITDFILGSITNVYSNGLLVATGAYVVPPAAGLQGAGGDNMLGAYGESLEPAG